MEKQILNNYIQRIYIKKNKLWVNYPQDEDQKLIMKNKSVTQRVNECLGTDYKGLITKKQWEDISSHQKLSESFIREFQDKIDWEWISIYQNLSEDFIREFQHKVNWYWISIYQNLSENFIREFQDKVNWYRISVHQKLSEPFIREFQHKVNWNRILKYQKLSNEFIEEFKDRLYLSMIKDSWHYKTTEEKKQAVMATGLYECHDTYFIAYKGIRSDRYSKFNFLYKYEKGGIYESWCDCSNDENSFGLSVWDEPNARKYSRELVVRVKVNYEDVGRVVHNGGKIRCFKLEVLD